MPEKTPWDERTTLLRPPPNDKSKAPIENALEVTELGVLGPVRLHPAKWTITSAPKELVGLTWWDD